MEKRFLKRLHDSVNYSLNNLYVNNDDNKMSNNKQQPRPENPNDQFSNTEPLTHAQKVAIANTMSNNKQSSVDIIYQGMSDKIVMQDLNKALICIHISHDDFLKLHKQAKAMHKEEQIDSLIEGMYKGQEVYFSEHKIKLDGNSSVFCAAIAEQYYNSTFGGNNEQQ